MNLNLNWFVCARALFLLHFIQIVPWPFKKKHHQECMCSTSAGTGQAKSPLQLRVLQLLILAELTKLWISTCGQANFGDKLLQHVYSSTLGGFNHPCSTQWKNVCICLCPPLVWAVLRGVVVEEEDLGVRKKSRISEESFSRKAIQNISNKYNDLQNEYVFFEWYMIHEPTFTYTDVFQTGLFIYFFSPPRISFQNLKEGWFPYYLRIYSSILNT